MRMKLVSTGVAALVVSSLAVAAGAAPDRRPPRIVAAAIVDADRDARADGARLTYSERVRHAADRDGRYSFTVAGYRIRSVGAARGKVVLLLLVERAAPDTGVRPLIRYRRTGAQPVRDRAGNQALEQRFPRARPHGTAPPASPPPAPPGSPPPAAPSPPTDSDGDGTLDGQDCAPRDAAIHPGAADLPDLAFVDSNCDGLDGTERDAVFASPQGKNTNSGTRGAPKREISDAVVAAADTGRYVLAAAGSYGRVVAATRVGIHGGYDPGNWSIRRASLVTRIAGAPEGVLASNVTGVDLQLLSVHGSSAGSSAYGIRAINSSRLRLQRVTVSAADGVPGAPGANGAPGLPGRDGRPGGTGECDHNVPARGGAGGDSPVGRYGGEGGDGRYESDGDDGAMGLINTPGGEGGAEVETVGKDGSPGATGISGARGPAGTGGSNSTALASVYWQGQNGTGGLVGGPGNGGGGGGAGGGQDDFTVLNGTGNGGGGGGGGGAGGSGGGGGLAGGGSFGIYLHDSALVAEGSTITAGNGGAGGRGGSGGSGGGGGGAGVGAVHCSDEIGNGADGGFGGSGGQGGGGGGGAGGPSIGIVKLGAAAVLNLTDTKVKSGNPGPGGFAGAGGTPAPLAQAGITQGIYP